MRCSLNRFSTERHLGSSDHDWSPTPTVKGDKLSDVILLEVFDLYWLGLENGPYFKKVWSNRNGWFKLGHGRSVVLASPSGLRLRLLFAHEMPTGAVAVEHRSHLPIVVDHGNVAWNVSAQKRLTSALRYLKIFPRHDVHARASIVCARDG